MDKLDVNCPSQEYLLGFFEYMTYPKAGNPYDAFRFTYQHDEWEKGKLMAKKLNERIQNNN